MKSFLKAGCITAISIVAIIFIAGFIYNYLDDSKKEEIYNVQEDEIFKERLDATKDYEDGNYTMRYEELAKNLNGVYSIETLDYNFSFRRGLKKLVVIPIENGELNSDLRKDYDIKFGGPIERRLSFAIKDKLEKGIIDLQFDSQINKHKILVVKYIVNDSTYCKRGLLVNNFQ